MDNVIVTGASRGIGLAIAERLVRDGFRVVAVARRNSEALTAAAASLSERDSRVLTFWPMDLGEVEAFPNSITSRTASLNSGSLSSAETPPESSPSPDDPSRSSFGVSRNFS